MWDAFLLLVYSSKFMVHSFNIIGMFAFSQTMGNKGRNSEPWTVDFGQKASLKVQKFSAIVDPPSAEKIQLKECPS